MERVTHGGKKIIDLIIALILNKKYMTRRELPIFISGTPGFLLPSSSDKLGYRKPFTRKPYDYISLSNRLGFTDNKKVHKAQTVKPT